MNIQNISSLPPYLSQFVNTNHEQLNDIYMKSREHVGPGILSFKVNGSDNRVDVKYMPEEEILQSMDREALEGLYRQAKQNGDKKIYLIEDIQISYVYCLYIIYINIYVS